MDRTSREEREHVVKVPLHAGKQVEISWSRTRQHILSWEHEISLEVNGEVWTLDPGSCNLYLYPQIVFAPNPTVPLANHLKKPRRSSQAGSKVHLLKCFNLLLIEALTSEATHQEFALPDATGAFPVLALLVANTPEAVNLARLVYERRPELLLQTHTPLGIFKGENVLHVLCVNLQEMLLCQMIELAISTFDRGQLRKMFTEQAAGTFFDADPMRFYGSTPLAYAVSFSLKHAVRLMIAHSVPLQALHGIVGFNHRRHACTHTGPLPPSRPLPLPPTYLVLQQCASSHARRPTTLAHSSCLCISRCM